MRESDFFHTGCQPIRLSPQELNQPHDVISGFFDNHCLSESQNHLWHLLCAALSSNECCADNSQSRSELLFFYSNLSKLIEATSLIANHP